MTRSRGRAVGRRHRASHPRVTGRVEQKMTDAYHLGSRFVTMFSYERSVVYPEGHRKVLFAQRGIRPLARLPKVANDAPFAPAPDTSMFYQYLRHFGGVPRLTRVPA